MIEILLVEDSATVRRHLSRVFSAQEDMRVVGEVADGDAAVEAAGRLRPSVIVLDVFIPRQSAANLVRHLLATNPVPVVLVSDAPKDTAEVFAALEAGALDFVAKPRAGDAAAERWLVETVRALQRVRVRRRAARAAVDSVAGRTASLSPAAKPVVVIGASAGGPAALRELMAQLPHGLKAPVLIAQHLAEGFDGGLAQWLGENCALPVRVAEEGEIVPAGEVRVGRAGTDLSLQRGGRLKLTPAPSGGYHPSVDALFESSAAVAGASTIAVVLSGIGKDGTAGAGAVVSVGGQVLAQDRASSAVFGMPAAVARAGHAQITGSPEVLGRTIVRLLAGTTLRTDVTP